MYTGMPKGRAILRPGPGSRAPGPPGAFPATRPMLRPGPRCSGSPMLQAALASGSEHPCEARSTVVGVPYPPGMGDSTTMVTADPVEPAALTEARPDPDTGSTEPAPEPGKDTGPAGPSLSPSRAGDFLTCPLLYRFRVIDRLPEPPSPAAARGTLV